MNQLFLNLIAAGLQPAVPPFPERDSFWMPRGVSTSAGHVDWLYYFIYWTSAAVTVGVVAAMVYFVVKFRAKSRSANEKPTATSDHNTTLEITWSVLPMFFMVAFFYFGFKGYLELRTPPQGAQEVHVQGQKWSWSFTHKNGCQDNVLHVPVNKPVRLIISSVDVLHSVWIPNFRVKMDAVPGRYTDLWFEATEPGEFPLECTEYCGTSHSDMLSKVVVQSQSEYDSYLDECTKVDITAEGGQKVYEKKGCATCHTVDGSPKVGPSFKGLWGSERSFASGSPVTADENYIKESILEPQAKIVTGFPPSMPTYKGQISDDEITALIEYLKTLK